MDAQKRQDLLNAGFSDSDIAEYEKNETSAPPVVNENIQQNPNNPASVPFQVTPTPSVTSDGGNLENVATGFSAVNAALESPVGRALEGGAAGVYGAKKLVEAAKAFGGNRAPPNVTVNMPNEYKVGRAPVPVATPAPMAPQAAPTAQNFIQRMAALGKQYAPAAARIGTGIGAMLYSPSLGPEVPEIGPLRGSELNPKTHRLWTKEELAQYNQFYR